MNAQLDMTRVPLHQLAISSRNARKTGGRDAEDLAASIAANGLLQNLVVIATCDATGADMFEVVAGGRRLAAMQLLAMRKELPASLVEGIPCRVINDDDEAIEVSTAENTLREAMHPADQFDAFKAMVDAKKPIEDVAAHFGVTPIVVKQRLKLANVNPQLFTIYREGGMSLEQLQALAITDNHEAQRQAWATKHDWERDARSIRERITRSEVHANSPLARFVGVDAYIAAGGSVRSDLFSNRGDAWLQDKALLDKLALDKLEEVAAQERDAGWNWVETHLSLDYSEREQYGRAAVQPQQIVYASPEDEARDAECAVRIEAIEDIDADSLSDAEADALQDELSKLQDEREDIEARMDEIWPAETMAVTGVLIFLDNSGLNISRGRTKPGQKVDKATGVVTGQAKPSKAQAKPKKPELSAAVLQTLSAHRSEVARHHVARDPQLALALLVDWYVARMKHDFGDAHVLNLQVTSVPDARKVAPDIHKALDDETGVHAACFRKIPRKEQRLAWLIQQPQADLLQMLAYCVGNRFGALSDNPTGHPGIAALHSAIGFDMAQHWNPGCDQFLERIPRSLVEEAVEEACRRKGMMDPKGCAANVLTNKGKAAIAAAAGKFIAGSGWLPKPLRGPGYDKAATKAKAPAKKATSKKPSKPTAKTKKPSAKSAKKATAK